MNAAKSLDRDYLSLVQDVLLGQFDHARISEHQLTGRGRFIERLLRSRGFVVGRVDEEDRAAIESGDAWPKSALTMIGRKRLDNIEACLRDVVEHGVPGDFIETGVWRGGGSIYARAVLRALGAHERTVWVADSFAGLPAPDVEAYPADADAFPYHEADALAVGLQEVRQNFSKLGLLDQNVEFVQGWFKDTLPALDATFAVIRLDGDLYESTIQALGALYPKLSPGGWAIIDDYGHVPVCRQAVDDYRKLHDIPAELRWVDAHGVFWQKSRR